MPEITITHIALLVIALIGAVVVGWVLRGKRSTREKSAINVGWQEQLEAQRNEHERLLDQNKSLMEQNSQYQASNKDSKMRAGELSDALKEAFERRDELQRQIKDIRGNLEAAVAERDQLASDMQDRDATETMSSQAIRERDETIAKLTKELASWQERVPPLVERFRVRNEEALQIESELEAARQRIRSLEDMVGSEHTRVEPIDRDALGDDLNASNEPLESAADTADAGTLADPDTSAAAADDARDQEAAAGSGIHEQRDDLKKIKGVGPAIEKTLNEMGICRFDQIAEMSEYDIDRVAKKLKGLRSRIYREDWIGQARDLHDQNSRSQA